MGYSSRILAESWESNNLYWVALADELSLRPAQLNVRIPQWTQQLVERIFASHLEDWPALLRSLRAVGDDVREHARAASADQKRRFKICPPEATMTLSRRGFLAAAAGGTLLRAQEPQGPVFRVKVDMVVHSFQVTDSKNHYINGLKPADFRIFEDGIAQKISTFAEGANTPVAINADGTTTPLLNAKGPCRAWTVPMLSSAPTFSFCSIPVISCTAALSMPKMRSPISCAAWITPIRWPSTLSAATCRARLRSPRARRRHRGLTKRRRRR